MGPDWLMKGYFKNEFDDKVDWTQFLDGVWGDQKEAWDSLKTRGKESMRMGLKPRNDI